jgi:hypothetical protein
VIIIADSDIPKEQVTNPIYSLSVTPENITMDFINNVINMSMEGASLRETSAQFWNAIEMLRVENPSATAVIDKAMDTGGRL